MKWQIWPLMFVTSFGESQLHGEAAPVSELHFTPGTPFNLKMFVSVNF